MKFISNIVLTLGLSTAVFANPIAEKRQTTSVPVTLSTLQGTASNYGVAITSALNSVKGDVIAELNVVAAIGKNLSAIVTALQTAGTSITAATSSVGSQGLDQADIDQITAILNSLTGVLTSIVADLPPLVSLALSSEFLALQGAVIALVGPLQALFTALSGVNSGTGLSTNGFSAAAQALAQVLGGIVLPTGNSILGSILKT